MSASGRSNTWFGRLLSSLRPVRACEERDSEIPKVAHDEVETVAVLRQILTEELPEAVMAADEVAPSLPEPLETGARSEGGEAALLALQADEWLVPSSIRFQAEEEAAVFHGKIEREKARGEAPLLDRSVQVIAGDESDLAWSLTPDELLRNLDPPTAREATDSTGGTSREAAIGAWLEELVARHGHLEQDQIDDLVTLLETGPMNPSETRERLVSFLHGLGLDPLDEPEESLLDASVAFPDPVDLVDGAMAAVECPRLEAFAGKRQRLPRQEEDRAFADLRRAWRELHAIVADEPKVLLAVVDGAIRHLDGVQTGPRFSGIDVDWRKRREEASEMADLACRLYDLASTSGDGMSPGVRSEVIGHLSKLEIETGFLRAIAHSLMADGLARSVAADIVEKLDRIGAVEHRLLLMHRGHVRRLALQYVDRGLDEDDLCQVAFLGLMKSIRRFDPSRGYRLQTYAAWWMRQCIVRAIQDEGATIRVPVHREGALRLVSRVADSIEARTLREASPSQIAARLGADEISIEKILRIPRIAVPAEEAPEPLEDDPAPDALATKQLEAAIAQLLDQMPERRAEILRRRFGLGGADPETLEEIGQSEGVTRERIRQIEAKAIDWLRHPARAKILASLR